MITRIHGRAEVLAASYAGPLFDCVITDAPYPTIDRHRNVGSPSERLREWFETLAVSEILAIVGALGALVRPGGFLAVCLDAPSWADACRLEAVHWEKLRGWDPPRGQITGLSLRSPLVWAKTSRRYPDRPWGGMGYYFRNAFELVALWQRPGPLDPYVRGKLRGQADVIQAPKLTGKGLWPTEKPEELGSVLVGVLCPPGGRALDPFAGAGRWLAPGCALEGRDLVLWDASDRAPSVARRRVGVAR